MTQWPIGEDKLPFIIAEVCINHNGEQDKALTMFRVTRTYCHIILNL